MKGVASLTALPALLAACTGPEQQPGDRVHPVHGPSVSKPGVSISGNVRVGVVKKL